jgi:MarR family transcriptional regulator for hemolysin
VAATASSASTPLDHLLAHRLAVAGRLVRTMADAELSDVGVAAPACGVLLRLAGEDGLTQAEIARRQRVEAPTMCRTIDRLVRDGLVERRIDPADRRASRIHLTAAGRGAAADGAHVVEAIEARAFAGLDRAEREALAELLGRVIESLAPAPSPGMPA